MTDETKFDARAIFAWVETFKIVRSYHQSGYNAIITAPARRLVFNTRDLLRLGVEFPERVVDALADLARLENFVERAEYKPIRESLDDAVESLTTKAALVIVDACSAPAEEEDTRDPLPPPTPHEQDAFIGEGRIG